MAQKRDKYHYFLDEAGDCTFFNKAGLPLLGQNGVSNTFMIGMAHFDKPLEPLRQKIRDLQHKIENDRYYKSFPSVQKRIREKGGFYFHAKDDIPELRKVFFDFLLEIDCRCEVVVGRKDLGRFVQKHNRRHAEFYADLLSHLITPKLADKSYLTFNMAQLGNITSQHNLNIGLRKAEDRFYKNNPHDVIRAKIDFQDHQFTHEPLLAIVDYFLWAVQRVFEKDEARYYTYLNEKIVKVTDLYDPKGVQIYTGENPLVDENKISL